MIFFKQVHAYAKNTIDERWGEDTNSVPLHDDKEPLSPPPVDNRQKRLKQKSRPPCRLLKISKKVRF